MDAHICFAQLQDLQVLEPEEEGRDGCDQHRRMELLAGGSQAQGSQVGAVAHNEGQDLGCNAQAAIQVQASDGLVSGEELSSFKSSRDQELNVLPFVGVGLSSV